MARRPHSWKRPEGPEHHACVTVRCVVTLSQGAQVVTLSWRVPKSRRGVPAGRGSHQLAALAAPAGSRGHGRRAGGPEAPTNVAWSPRPAWPRQPFMQCHGASSQPDAVQCATVRATASLGHVVDASGFEPFGLRRYATRCDARQSPTHGSPRRRGQPRAAGAVGRPARGQPRASPHPARAPRQNGLLSCEGAGPGRPGLGGRRSDVAGRGVWGEQRLGLPRCTTKSPAPESARICASDCGVFSHSLVLQASKMCAFQQKTASVSYTL